MASKPGCQAASASWLRGRIVSIASAESLPVAVTPSSSFSLQELAKAHPLAEFRRRLAADGVALPIVIDGVEIEFEFRCGDHTLIATSYDYFDGSRHWIYLLRRDGKPIDQLSLPEQFGFLQGLEMISPTEIVFGFYGTKDRWNLVVHPSGFWSFAPRTLFSRPGRLWLSRRRLALRHAKGGVWSEPAASAAATESAVSDRPNSATHLRR